MSPEQVVIKNFFASFPVRSFSKNQVLVRPEDPIERIYYIQSGLVKEYDIAENGSEIIMNVLKSGAYFSLTQAIITDKYRWFYETLEPTQLRSAPVSDVLNFLKEHPGCLVDIFRRVSSGALGTQRRLFYALSGSAVMRVAFELHVEFSRFGVIEDGKHILHITEAELATRCGLSREVVSKTLTELKKRGLINKAYKMITTDNLDQLRGLVDIAFLDK